MNRGSPAPEPHTWALPGPGGGEAEPSRGGEQSVAVWYQARGGRPEVTQHPAWLRASGTRGCRLLPHLGPALPRSGQTQGHREQREECLGQKAAAGDRGSGVVGK